MPQVFNTELHNFSSRQGLTPRTILDQDSQSYKLLLVFWQSVICRRIWLWITLVCQTEDMIHFNPLNNGNCDDNVFTICLSWFTNFYQYFLQDSEANDSEFLDNLGEIFPQLCFNLFLSIDTKHQLPIESYWKIF